MDPVPYLATHAHVGAVPLVAARRGAGGVDVPFEGGSAQVRQTALDDGVGTRAQHDKVVKYDAIIVDDVAAAAASETKSATRLEVGDGDDMLRRMR